MSRSQLQPLPPRPPPNAPVYLLTDTFSLARSLSLSHPHHNPPTSPHYCVFLSLSRARAFPARRTLGLPRNMRAYFLTGVLSEQATQRKATQRKAKQSKASVAASASSAFKSCSVCRFDCMGLTAWVCPLDPDQDLELLLHVF